MEWINGLFCIHTALQATVVLSLIISIGLALGKLRIKGISLGVAFVFFIGIIAGHFQLSIDTTVLQFAETFGLTLFVYTLGLYVGPNFFGLMRHEGIANNLWSFAVIALGTIMALGLCFITPISLPDMMGILCGATTNTPALGAAQQALESVGLSGKGAALGCAVTYPLGVIGVILGMIFIRRFFVKSADLKPKNNTETDKTYVVQFEIINPALNGKTLEEISRMSHIKFIMSRVWRNNDVIVPFANTKLQLGDNVMVVTTVDEVAALEMLFGKKIEKDWNKQKIDWNAIDTHVESRIIILSRQVLNGRHLGSLHLRDTYGVNVSRIRRGDVKLLATDDLRLQFGDRVTVVGAPQDIDHVEGFLGNTAQNLNEPNLGAILIGIILGLALGTIPVNIPGMDVPMRLGIAGGPIIVGILIGSLGPRAHIISYTTPSASLMLRKLGLSLYLACLGLEAGNQFFETIVRPEGLLWIGIGLAITIIPVIIIGIVTLFTHKYDFGTICGILCGSMANPMALGYANDTLSGDTASISYASVYPLGMFLRVVIAQVVIMIFCS
mgnify:CR=1 FL=1